MHGPAAGQSIKVNGFARKEFLWQVVEMKAHEVTDLLAIDVHYTDRFSTPDHMGFPSVAGITMSRLSVMVRSSSLCVLATSTSNRTGLDQKRVKTTLDLRQNSQDIQDSEVGRVDPGSEGCLGCRAVGEAVQPYVSV